MYSADYFCENCKIHWHVSSPSPFENCCFVCGKHGVSIDDNIFVFVKPNRSENKPNHTYYVFYRYGYKEKGRSSHSKCLGLVGMNHEHGWNNIFSEENFLSREAAARDLEETRIKALSRKIWHGVIL